MRDRNALRKGLKLLDEGKVLGLFPEGTRSKDGVVKKGLAGAGFSLCDQMQQSFLVQSSVSMNVPNH